MIDVGNDREFGFLDQPNLERLEADLFPALDGRSAAGGAPAELQLASFFRLPERTRNHRSRWPCCEALPIPDAEVREAARLWWPAAWNSTGAEDDPERIAAIAVDSGRKLPPTARPSCDAIGRNERLAARPELLATIRKLIARPEAAPSLLPVLHWPAVSDAEVLSLSSKPGRD